MRAAVRLLGVLVIATACAHSRPPVSRLPAHEALAATSVAIRAAFARGDVDGGVRGGAQLLAGRMLENSIECRTRVAAGNAAGVL